MFPLYEAFSFESCYVGDAVREVPGISRGDHKTGTTSQKLLSPLSILLDSMIGSPDPMGLMAACNRGMPSHRITSAICFFISRLGARSDAARLVCPTIRGSWSVSKTSASNMVSLGSFSLNPSLPDSKSSAAPSLEFK